MARKPETQFIQSIHKNFKENSPHHEKMNNPYRSGTADVWYSGSRADLWVEYKFLPRIPVSTRIYPDVTPQQELWLRRRHAEGRAVYVVVGCSDGGVVYSVPGLIHLTPDEFKSRILTRGQIARWIQEFVGAGSCLKPPSFSGQQQ
jgi:hypothetical protein